MTQKVKKILVTQKKWCLEGKTNVCYLIAFLLMFSLQSYQAMANGTTTFE